ncbi:MAG: glycosyltransferase involved in cell wall biosynthesis [Oleiphilaceae bacterium]|jgi:glycosyltransferase involved in cell wall biosynthesis
MPSHLNQPKKLRILQVLPSLFSGGVERSTLDLCRYLVDQGHEAWVVSAGGPLVEALEIAGAIHVTLPVHSKNPLTMWKNSFALIKLHQQQSFDIIHARSRAPAWSCYWASKKICIPFVTTFHGQYGHQNSFKKMYNGVMLKGDVCIAVSEFIASHITEIYPQHKTKIKLIREGIDLVSFSHNSPSVSISDLKAHWAIDNNHTVIILPGRLTRIKGHQIFLEALSQLKDASISCLIVGDETGKDHYQKELQEFIAAHQLSSIVKFTGNYYDMPAMYALADIVISASIKPESFGLIACEAQAMGCLVVATKHGGSLETIAPCQKQFMCEIKDSLTMAQAIKHAIDYCDINNQNLKQKIQIESREYIEQNFSLERMCQETLSLYTSLMLNHGSD